MVITDFINNFPHKCPLIILTKSESPMVGTYGKLFSRCAYLC